MSGVFSRLGTLARTLSHLRARQFAAQVAHGLSPGVRPVATPVEPPELALEAPRCAFLGPPPHARWHSDGRLELVGLTARCDPSEASFDFGAAPHGPLYAYQVHFAEYLRGDEVDRERRRAWIDRWIAESDAPSAIGPGWDPHPLSVRTMVWGKLLLEPERLELAPEAHASLRRSLARQLDTLARHLEHRLQANHLLHNQIAVCFGGLLLAGASADRWLAVWPALRSEIGRQLGNDGAHEERSPMYHSVLLEALLDLHNLALVAAERGRPVASEIATALSEVCGSARGALRTWTHPDGAIALFADSAFDLAQPPAALHEYADRLGVAERAPQAPGWLHEARYARLESEHCVVVASVGGPAPAHQPGHAHADALSFEASIGGRRVVTDTGVFEYRPGERRQVSRATCSHATVEIGGFDQAELWAAHRVGGRPEVEVLHANLPEAFEASCRGWATPRTLHRRRFSLEGAGVLRIEDRIEGRAEALRFSLPLAPGLEIEAGPGQALWIRAEAGGPRVASLELPPLPRAAAEGAPSPALALPPGWRVERTPYFPRFGDAQERWSLIGECAAATGLFVTVLRAADAEGDAAGA